MTERYELAQQLAEAALGRAGINPDPAIDTPELAHGLGVTVREAVIEEDGRLRVSADGPVALVRRDRPWERKRFTLCHELAHWLVRSDQAGAQLTARAIQKSQCEEYLCDKVASAMLMPRAWIRRYRAWPRALATVSAVAEAAGVSRSAALVRLRDELGWRESLLLWKRYRERWVLDGQAGLYPAQQGLVRTTEGTRTELLKAAAGQHRPRDPLPLQFAFEELDDLPAEISATSERAIVLIELPYPPPDVRRPTVSRRSLARRFERTYS